MFSKVVGFVLIFTACAKPNYQNISSGFDSGPHPLAETCSARLKNTTIATAWKVFPTESQMGSFALHFTPSFLGDSVQVVLWMPSMGHGSSPTTVERLSESSFLVTNVFFIMPGEWEMRFVLKAGECVDEVVQKITL